jgi:hypothetical protein
MKLLGIISEGFDVTDQLLIRFFVYVRYWRKNLEYTKTVHQLFVDFKKAYDSVRREVLYNILIEFGVPMKLIRLGNSQRANELARWLSCDSFSVVFLATIGLCFPCVVGAEAI